MTMQKASEFRAMLEDDDTIDAVQVEKLVQSAIMKGRVEDDENEPDALEQALSEMEASFAKGNGYEPDPYREGDDEGTPVGEDLDAVFDELAKGLAAEVLDGISETFAPVARAVYEQGRVTQSTTALIKGMSSEISSLREELALVKGQLGEPQANRSPGTFVPMRSPLDPAPTTPLQKGLTVDAVASFAADKSVEAFQAGNIALADKMDDAVKQALAGADGDQLAAIAQSIGFQAQA